MAKDSPNPTTPNMSDRYNVTINVIVKDASGRDTKDFAGFQHAYYDLPYYAVVALEEGQTRMVEASLRWGKDKARQKGQGEMLDAAIASLPKFS